MDLLDLVHILAFPSNSIVIEHVAICQASQLRAWELCISTEIKPMNRNTNDVWGIQYKQSTCHSRNWQRPRQRECHAGVQFKMKNKGIMWRLRHGELFSPVAAVDEAEADLEWDGMGKAGPRQFDFRLRPRCAYLSTTTLPFRPHNHYKEKRGSKLYEVDTVAARMIRFVTGWMALWWTPWVYKGKIC